MNMDAFEVAVDRMHDEEAEQSWNDWQDQNEDEYGKLMLRQTIAQEKIADNLEKIVKFFLG